MDSRFRADIAKAYSEAKLPSSMKKKCLFPKSMKQICQLFNAIDWCSNHRGKTSRQVVMFYLRLSSKKIMSALYEVPAARP